MIIEFTPKVDKKIRNIWALPLGLNCKYLLCIKSHHEDPRWIAKQWKRKKPKALAPDEVLIVFK